LTILHDDGIVVAGSDFAEGLRKRPLPNGHQGGAIMPQDLEKRVETLEGKVNLLEQLPARVGALESQVLQLRDEMRAEFSATRSELRNEFRQELAASATGLRQEIREGDEETRRLMRVLHEEVLARIETLGRG
jgi:predicted  nucleic acid-binding Zn-ribbon protein